MTDRRCSLPLVCSFSSFARSQSFQLRRQANVYHREGPTLFLTVASNPHGTFITSLRSDFVPSCVRGNGKGHAVREPLPVFVRSRRAGQSDSAVLVPFTHPDGV